MERKQKRKEEMAEPFPLAKLVGISQVALKTIVERGDTEERLFRFLYGDLHALYEKLPKPSFSQRWDTPGKRFTHLEDSKFLVRHFLRTNSWPKSQSAMVLLGTEPLLACLPWIMSGIATDFVGYEIDSDRYKKARSISEEYLNQTLLGIEDLWPVSKSQKISILMAHGCCLKDQGEKKYGIFDLDFCRNELRTEEGRRCIVNLLNRSSPKTGQFALRITIHVGRAGNSKKDIRRYLASFEDKLWAAGYEIRANMPSPYQSTVPMMSITWVLERA